MGDVVVFVLLVGVVSGVLFGWRAVHNARRASRRWIVDEVETPKGTRVFVKLGPVRHIESGVELTNNAQVKWIGGPIPNDADFGLELEIRRNQAIEFAVALNHK